MARPPLFDPRQVPVIGVDAHLPALAQQRLTAKALAQQFQSVDGWMPELHTEARFVDKELADASVLIPIVMRKSPTVLLTQRTAHLSSHSGQIAFPGGKADATDSSPIVTALRETQEEVGLSANYIDVLGHLPLYTTGSAFRVTPVVALVREGFTLAPNDHEVADVFEVPLEFLMNPANHRRHAVHWEGARREWYSMPYQDQTQERFIWGATAGMLRNLYRFLARQIS